MIAEHAQAVLSLLAGPAKPLAIRVDDGKAPDPLPDVRANPYVLVYFDSNDPEADFTAGPWEFELTATCHSVAGSGAAARQVADWVRTALLGVVPSVAGRACWPIVREPGTPPQRDESTGLLVMDQIDVYVLRSVPG
jgi:hypothetical protein